MGECVGVGVKTLSRALSGLARRRAVMRKRWEGEQGAFRAKMTWRFRALAASSQVACICMQCHLFFLAIIPDLPGHFRIPADGEAKCALRFAMGRAVDRRPWNAEGR